VSGGGGTTVRRDGPKKRRRRRRRRREKEGGEIRSRRMGKRWWIGYGWIAIKTSRSCLEEKLTN
jgi:hypothetical protein